VNRDGKGLAMPQSVDAAVKAICDIMRRRPSTLPLRPGKNELVLSIQGRTAGAEVATGHARFELEME